MTEPLISVIVPVYKAEDYLEKCIRSICNQTYRKLEILLVDDGSPDHCGKICDALALQDDRIRVFHKENGGQSSARNLGLAHITGDYVTFADSDDWIEAGYYEKMMDLIRESGAQIAACGMRCDFPDGHFDVVNPTYTPDTPAEFFAKTDALREVTYAEKITNSPCDKIFSAEIFRDIRFPEQSAYEDFAIMVSLLERSELVAYYGYPYYHYRMTDESVTRGSFSQKHFMEGDISRERVSYYAAHYPELVSFAQAKHITLCLNIYVRSAGASQFAGERKNLKNELYRSFSFAAFSRMRRNTKIKYLMFLACPPLFSYLMNKRQRP